MARSPGSHQLTTMPGTRRITTPLLARATFFTHSATSSGPTILRPPSAADDDLLTFLSRLTDYHPLSGHGPAPRDHISKTWRTPQETQMTESGIRNLAQRSPQTNYRGIRGDRCRHSFFSPFSSLCSQTAMRRTVLRAVSTRMPCVLSVTSCRIIRRG